MSGENFSTCSITNFYERGKHIGYSLADGEMVSLSEEEPLEVPELFPVKKPDQPPKAGEQEPLLAPCIEDLFRKRDE
jgi:hypothetical protein